MRFAPWTAFLVIVVVATPSFAQSHGSHGSRGSGRGMHSGGRRIIFVDSAFGIPGYGFPPYFDYSDVRPGVMFVMPRFEIPPMPPTDIPPPTRAKEEKEKPIPFDPDGVLVFRPNPGGVKALPPPKLMPEPPPKKVIPPNANLPAMNNDPLPRQAPPPGKDKPAEEARQIKLGREAFSAGEYGRSAERFRQAARLATDDASPTFLLAQSLFAIGKYRDSVAAIYDGMKMMPDWPKEPFPPRQLYGEVVREFPAHLDRLRQAVERDPDPALLFLYGYQLWFDGRRADARTFLQKAAATVADPKPIERFLVEKN
jgi:hypothetical protein